MPVTVGPRLYWNTASPTGNWRNNYLAQQALRRAQASGVTDLSGVSTGPADIFVTATDAMFDGDIATRAFVQARDATDTMFGGDTATGALNRPRSATDAMFGGDAATRAVMTPQRSASDALFGGDTATRLGAFGRSASDSLLGTDSATGQAGKPRTATDALLGGDTATRSSTRVRSATDSLLGGDTATRVVAQPRTAADALLGTDTANAGAVTRARTAVDSLLGGDTATRSVLVFSRTTTDTLFAFKLVASSPDVTHNAQTPDLAVDRNVATWWQPRSTLAVGAYNPSLILDRGAGSGPFSSVRVQWYPDAQFIGTDYTIETSPDSSTWTVVRTIVGNSAQDRTLTFTQSTARYVRILVTGKNADTDPNYANLAIVEFSAESDTATRAVAQPRTATDSLLGGDTATRGALTRQRTATDLLLGGDTATRLVAQPRAAVDVLLGADVASRGAITRARTAADVLLGGDTATRSSTRVRSAVDVLLGGDTASRSAPQARSATDSILGADTATRDPLTRARTATDVLIGADAATAKRTVSRAATDALLVSDTATRAATTRARTAVDVLVGADAATRVRPLARTVADALLGSDTADTLFSTIQFDTSSSSAWTTTTTSRTVNTAPFATGSLMLVFGMLWAAPGDNTTTMTGWTRDIDHDDAILDMHVVLFHRVKQAGDTTFTMNLGASIASGELVIVSYTGQHPSAPVEGAAANDHTTTSTSFVSPTATPGGPGRWVVVAPAPNSATTTPRTITPDSELTERAEQGETLHGTNLEVADSAGPVTVAAHSYTGVANGTVSNDSATMLVFVVPRPTPTNLSRTAADALLVSDAAVVRVTLPRVVTDLLLGTDTPSRTLITARTATDRLLVSDAATRLAAFGRTASDTLTGADTATRAAPRARTATDRLLVSDSATSTVTGGGNRVATDALIGSDTATRAVTRPRTATDALLGSDVASRLVVRARSAVDQLLGSDIATRAISLARSAVDALLGTDSAIGQAGKARTTTDHLLVSDTATKAPATRARSATDALVGTDVAVRGTTHPARTTTDHLLGTDSARAARIFVRVAADHLFGGDVANPARIFPRLVADALFGGDTVSITTAILIFRFANEVLAPPTDAATRHVDYVRQSSEAIPLHEWVYRNGMTFYRTAGDTFSTSDTAAQTYLRAIQEILPIPTDVAIATRIFMRALSESAPAVDSVTRNMTMTRAVEESTPVADEYFDRGVWLTFPINVGTNGTVTIKATRITGTNTVLSGIFLGDAGPPISIAPQGSWVGTYGSDGYAIGSWYGGGVGDLVSLPPGASLSFDQGSRYSWEAPVDDVRALQSPDQSERRATTWYDNNEVRLTLSLPAGYRGNLHLYALDWDGVPIGNGRRQAITVDDGHGPQTINIGSGPQRKLISVRSLTENAPTPSESITGVVLRVRHANEILVSPLDIAVGTLHRRTPDFGPPVVTVVPSKTKISRIDGYDEVTLTITFDRPVSAWVVRVGSEVYTSGEEMAAWHENGGGPVTSATATIGPEGLLHGLNKVKVFAQSAADDEWSGATHPV
jgi:hypothetical protein